MEPSSPVHRRSLTKLHTVFALAAACIVLLTCLVGVFLDIVSDLPPIDPALLKYRQSVQIEDRDGGELYRMYGDEDRITLDADGISPYLRAAIVAIEDERFYTRSWCVDPIAVARSAVSNLWNGRVTQGGSTITQQLVRSVYLSNEQTLRRKIREAVLACQMEQLYSKDQILTMYLNRVPFGGTLYGAERAAQAYFGVSAKDLTLPQAAVLAAIPQRPSWYTDPERVRTAVDHDLMNDLRKGVVRPRSIPDDALQSGLLGRAVSTPEGEIWIDGRAEAVVHAMRRTGSISRQQELVAGLVLRRISLQRSVQPRTAPHFVEAMRLDVRELLAELGDADAWLRSGMRVRTTIDPRLQAIAERTVKDSQQALRDAGARHAALVAIDRQTREVLAYVGNVDYDDPDNGAVDMAASPRQTGSAIKPVIYAADLARNGTNSGTFILDGPLPELGNPKNYDGGFRGWMRVKNALGASRNLPAIRAFFDAGGEDDVLRIAASMGISTPLAYSERARETDPWFAYGWPMAIGSAEVPLTELVQAYATIAEGGAYVPLRTVDRIDASDGSVLLRIPRTEPTQAVDARAANEIDEILRDPLVRPKGFWRDMLTIPGIETGAKTGTSNLCLRRSRVSTTCLSYAVNNVWTVGYDDRIVVGVWVGNADNAPMDPTADGLTVAAPIWREFMLQAHGRAVSEL